MTQPNERSRFEGNELLEKVTAHAAKRIAGGANPSDVKWELTGKIGVPDELAEQLVSALSERWATTLKHRAAAFRSASFNKITIGVGILLIGALVTYGSYRDAQGGGIYIVMGGAIVGGFLYALIGLIELTTGKPLK